MDAETLLPRLFPQGHAGVFDGEFFTGPARCGATDVTVIGARNKAPIGVELAHRMAGAVLQTGREHPGRPIVLLDDTSGQRLSRRDELLGVNGYMAHLAKCLELARRSGHRTLGLVYGEAVSGGFLATSLLADACYALPEAEIRVMNLPAMARVTKIPLERLQELSKTSAVFAPGVENYHRMGAIRALWDGDLSAHLEAALAEHDEGDRRRQDGEARGDGPWPAPLLIACAAMQPDPLTRHSWVWLAEGWAGRLRGRPTAETIALAERWRALDRPFIVASPGAHDSEDDLRLSLALPDKRRIGLHLPQAAVVRSAPPPSLREVVAQAPAVWRPRLREVESMAQAAGLSVAVYGSLAWEYRCSTAYVRADSYVDLLFEGKAAPSLGPVLTLARALSPDAGAPRLDGELILPGGAAVAWREFARRPEELLIKGAGGPALCTRASIEALFARAAA